MKKLLALLLVLFGVCACAMAETTEVILTCTGDFMPGSNDRIKNENFAFQRYIEQYGWGYPFEKLQVLFAKDDITLVNLECMLNDSAKDSTSRLRFRGPESYAAIFPASSIDIDNIFDTEKTSLSHVLYFAQE